MRKTFFVVPGWAGVAGAGVAVMTIGVPCCITTTVSLTVCTTGVGAAVGWHADKSMLAIIRRLNKTIEVFRNIVTPPKLNDWWGLIGFMVKLVFHGSFGYRVIIDLLTRGLVGQIPKKPNG
jgi:hypothetical protein